jgi:hypothetical protein
VEIEMTIAGAASESDAPQAVKSGPPREPASLHLRYGKIGISAVAAAARYAGMGKNGDRAVRMVQIDQRFIELAP